MASLGLRDRRILVVEDEYLVAMSLARSLARRRLNCRWARCPLSIRRSRQSSRSLTSTRAVLDVNLGGVLAYPVADLLIARNIPFVFTSGYEDNLLRDRYSQVKNCAKPYLFTAMEEALVEAMSPS